ncbi:MAG: hypothetical protein MUC50_16230 [Myxococcota bacterium]|jgi:hypothetical protein|nr:hypothetical protein [Myxococcota bacterium]
MHVTDVETWMESECSVSAGQSRGTEWDWLQFYWNTFTDGADWIPIDKISGKPWSDIWARVQADLNLSIDQRVHFDQMAQNAGVAY